MGLYLNPSNQTGTHDKLDIISRTKGVAQITLGHFAAHIPGAENKWGVCIIDNGYFNAAGVAFNISEREAFVSTQGRPKQFFLASFDAIKELSPDIAEIIVKYYTSNEEI